jgi:P-type Cu2+ transporter
LLLEETLVLREDLSVAEALRLAAALEVASEHPVGRAIIQAVAADAIPSVEDLRAVTGQGVEGRLLGRQVRLGSPEYAALIHAEPLPPALAGWVAGGDTVVAMADAEGWLAAFRLADRVRSGALAAVANLKASGRHVSAMSGDSPAAVGRVAESLGIEAWEGGMTPEGKHEAITRLQAKGALVAMVGDGVNDAPVLAQAQVSIAMGGGTDLARSQADVVLLSDNLGHLGEGLAVASKTLRIIRQNLGWAFAYNTIAIPLAMAGWVTPWMAGVGMSASSLLVVLNALRLQEPVRRRKGTA